MYEIRRQELAARRLSLCAATVCFSQRTENRTGQFTFQGKVICVSEN
jgi:hypothetical protein